MTTTRNAAPPTAIVDRVIEACWLALLALVPLVIAPEESVAGAIQGPKMFVFRSITTVLFVALTVSAANSDLLRALIADPSRRTIASIVQAIRSTPLALPVLAVLAANVLSFLFSPIRSVSWGGVDAGYDSYGLLTVLAFVGIFIAVAWHLRTQAQLLRMLWVIAAFSGVTGAYGFFQHLGYDFVQNTADAPVRLSLTFGNPIFGAAYLTMAIPLILALWETWRPRLTSLAHVGVGIALLLFPLFGIVYSLSRGPLVSVAFAFVVYLALVAYMRGLPAIRRPALVIVVALAAVIAMGWIPAPGSSNTPGVFADRIGSIGGALTPGGGGISGRYSIWEGAFDSYTKTPWVDTAVDPSLPGLGVGPFRRIVGFGQDMFGVAFRAVGADVRLGALERNAHNFAIHTLVELGMLGLLAYLWLAGATVYLLWRLLRVARQADGQTIIPVIAIGFLALFMGRLLEQTIGKAQISDLMLMWVALGVVAALASIELDPESNAKRPLPRRSGPARAHRSESPRAIGAWAALSIFSLLVAFLWWQGPLADIRALRLAAEAKQAGDAGNASASGALYQRAIEIAPHVAIPRLLLGQGLLNSARQDTNPVTALESLRVGQEVMGGIIERNPLDLRAREWFAGMTQEIALIDPTQWPQAIHDANIVVAMSPARWEQLEVLAWVLSLSGDLDAAMSTVEQAQALGGSTDPAAHLLYYIEAKIALERGNQERAAAALQRLRTFDHPDVPFLIEDVELGA